jgi:hypothetical protein
MNQTASIANTLTSLFLLPGDIACNILGIGKANNRDLLRMLINSFAWAFVGAIAVIMLV